MVKSEKAPKKNHNSPGCQCGTEISTIDFILPMFSAWLGGVIEFTGPPGVGKSFLIRELAKQGSHKKLRRNFSSIELNSFRKHLLQEKINHMPHLEDKELQRLRRDQWFCQDAGNEALLLDENLTQHQSREIVSALQNEVDGYEEFLAKRLVVILEDDPEAIMEKVRHRHENANHIWDGHRNKSKQEIIDISQRIMESRQRMHEIICLKGGHSLRLNAQTGTETMIKIIMEYPRLGNG